MKSNIVLGLESSSSRMNNLARQQMFFGRFIPVDEIVSEIDAVTPEDTQRLANQLFQPELLALTLLGNLGPMKIERQHLSCSVLRRLFPLATLYSETPNSQSQHQPRQLRADN